MPLFVASGPKRNDLYTSVTTPYALATDINTSLAAAGYTCTLVPAFNIAQFSGQPTNGDTLVLGSRTYTFKNTIASTGDVLIDATLHLTLSNLCAAVILGAGNGTKYIASTANPDVTAATATATASLPFTGTGVRINAISPVATTGFAIVLSKSSTVISFYYVKNSGVVALTSWGYNCISGVTPQGLRYRLFLNVVNGEVGFAFADQLRYIVTNTADTRTYGTVAPDDISVLSTLYGGMLRTTLSSAWRVIANQHQNFVFSNDVASGAAQYLWCSSGVPYIPSFQQAVSVVSASNASPIVFVTATAHGMLTGDGACVREVAGNTAANATSTITYISPTSFSLDGTTGNGAYVSGGIVGKLTSSTGGTISEFIWVVTTNDYGVCMFRSNLQSDGSQDYCIIFNDSVVNHNLISGNGTLKFVVPAPAFTSFAVNDLRFYNGQEFGSTAWLQAGTSASGTGYVVGAGWDMALVMQSETRDDFGSMLGYNFWNLTDSNNGSGSSVRGSVYVIVP